MSLDNSKNNLGTQIRSRIFWGTYLVDHLIGLLLGGSPTLKMNGTTIEETIELPDIDWIDEYSFPGKEGINDDGNDCVKSKILRISDPLRSVINLMSVSDNMMNEIFNNKDLKLFDKSCLVKQINVKIFE